MKFEGPRPEANESRYEAKTMGEYFAIFGGLSGFTKDAVNMPILVRRLILCCGSLPPLTAFPCGFFAQACLRPGCNGRRRGSARSAPWRLRDASTSKSTIDLPNLCAVGILAHGFTTGLTSARISSCYVLSDLQTSGIGGYPAGAASLGACADG